MDTRSRCIHTFDQHFHVRIDDHSVFLFLINVVVYLESVVEKNVRLKLVIIRIDYLYQELVNHIF